VKFTIFKPVLTGLAATVGIFVSLPAGAVPPPPPYAIPPEAPAATTPYQDGQISRGEIVVNYRAHHPIYYLDVYGAVDASSDTVWKAITSYDHYQDFLPLVVESGIKKREPGKCWQYVRMRPPWPLHDHWMVNANVEKKSIGNLSWTMADGNLRFEHGYWQITPISAKRCKLQYHLTVDPWLDIVPNWLVEMATKKILPDVIKGVRKRVQT
jgi:ribosome-associated toxin RatA of RatAB toxin-antitoxin module